jgi:chaperonin cofactor prefoldin
VNIKNRKELKKAISFIELAMEIVERIKEEEQVKFDNLPEALQYSEKGEIMEENVTTLEDATSLLDEAIATINAAAE